MYNLIINLFIIQTPQEVRHKSRTNKDSRVHSGFKQTMPTQKLSLHLLLYSIQESQTLMLALQIVPTAKKHNFSLCMSQCSSTEFKYSSTATFTELYVFAVCVMWPNICVLKSQDHLPISTFIKQAVSALKTFLAFNFLQSGDL